MRDVQVVRDDAAAAIARGDLGAALALVGELETREPQTATWPKRTGELYRRLGDPGSAVAAFERAIDRYVADGMWLQAIAVCKLILQIDPAHGQTATRLAELVASNAVRRPTVLPRSELEARRREGANVTLPPGGALDAIPLADVLPRARRETLADGTYSGISVLPVDVADAEPDSRARAALARAPLFANLSPAALEILVARLALREVTPGEVVFHEGDRGAALFVIADGEVAVETAGRELARLTAGAFFGEIALITDLPRSATVRALAATELLAIDRDALSAAAAEDPELIRTMLAVVRDRLVARVTHTSALFGPLSAADRDALAARFDVIEVDAGTALVSHGARADGLYVVLAGKVSVTRANELAPLATLGSGDVFGEMSLLGGGGGRGAADVRALGRVLALRLPAGAFHDVIVTYPQVLEYLGDLGDSRSRLRRAEQFIDLHIDLL